MADTAPTVPPELSPVHDLHQTINQAHRFVYFVAEAAEEYGALGAGRATGYFASRSAPLGPVPAEVVLATFYNFSPAVVLPAMAGAWEAATPAQWQAARFQAVGRAMERAGAAPSLEAATEARSLLAPVLDRLDLAGKPLAAANAAVDLPDDPFLALWQEVTVLREWRGDAHIALLTTNELDPCECMVIQVGTGRFPFSIAQATRGWTPEEWSAAVGRLTERGWIGPDGEMTATGVAERERIEIETDRLCAPIWSPLGQAEIRRLDELLAPIDAAMMAAGTYAAL